MFHFTCNSYFGPLLRVGIWNEKSQCAATLLENNAGDSKLVGLLLKFHECLQVAGWLVSLSQCNSIPLGIVLPFCCTCSLALHLQPGFSRQQGSWGLASHLWKKVLEGLSTIWQISIKFIRRAEISATLCSLNKFCENKQPGKEETSPHWYSYCGKG